MAERRPARPPTGAPPPQASLLEYLTANSLDQDYALVAARRQEEPDRARGMPSRGRPSPGRAGLVVLALFGALVATAGIQTARSAGVEESSHDNLVSQINSGADVLDERRTALTSLRDEVLTARRDNRGVRAALGEDEALVDRLGAVVGTFPVSGAGVRMVVNDAVDADEDAELILDKDLRNIVNGLWQAGAEAISINGQRVSSLTAIRLAGSFITVNYEQLAPPYVVLAIGDADRLPARFVDTTGGAAWLNAQETFGLRFEMEVAETLTVPAVSTGRLQLRNAVGDPVEGAQ